MNGTPQLIACADRFGGTIAGPHDLLSGPLHGVFDGVRLLPFYWPFDGVDAGFDPEDHTGDRSPPWAVGRPARTVQGPACQS
jgi:hypothetical protein